MKSVAYEVKNALRYKLWKIGYESNEDAFRKISNEIARPIWQMLDGRLVQCVGRAMENCFGNFPFVPSPIWIFYHNRTGHNEAFPTSSRP